ncbi:methylaspartate mutase subunit S [Spirochaeta isovalerica]|uniref:Glutamate mutase sigma subunit n=1 Tax=Spirochaeta isovalerica TaxID=150 RepID=A0A841R8X6_9SPIO|nr:methylaspartate mutase subunit S [Spirochaeta isovalerica]MBB6479811.1 methylaspartate mutase sigma subunit [Spirochaeta isovalerica]
MCKKTIVLGVIGSDCHAVGNKILDKFYSDAGFNVINLGVMVSQDEFIDSAIETGAEAILVSSLYGHGEIDCMGFRERCTERGLEDIVLHVGGNLVVGKMDKAHIVEKFKDMGYDRVYTPDVDLQICLEELRADLKC